MSPAAESSHPCAARVDSGGAPWRGRTFTPNPHVGDDGAADPALLAALHAFRGGSGDAVAVVDAYRSARLLVPLLAAKGDAGSSGARAQDLSIVTVAAPDGRRILPVFSSVGALSAWDPKARPVPVDGVRTALSAAADDTDLIVIDPGADTEFVLRRPAVWAIGQEQPWEPAHRSPEVYAGLQESIGGELGILDLSVAAGDPDARLRGPELIVQLELVDGLDRDELDAVLQRLAARWAADDRIAVLVDSLTVKLRRSRP